MGSRQQLYWVSQISGWLSYVVLMGALNQLSGGEFNRFVFYNLVATFLIGIFTSHLYRKVILKLNWLRLKIVQQIPRVFGASFLFGMIFIFLHTLIYKLLISKEIFHFDWLEELLLTLNLSVIFIMWSLLYFLYHFIRNYRKEEIKNLQWQALQNELELKNLKSQLNPHFIFNAMNTIRALIAENPEVAKDSVTRLANILRNSLLMGKEKFIPLSDELRLVNDYLNLEKSRFEERLKIKLEISDNISSYKIPPMLLQTLVENGIKHGISKVPKGGMLRLSANKQGTNLYIEIENDGQLKKNGEINTKEGFGLANTVDRLKLLYGKRASFSLENNGNNHVLAKLLIPTNGNTIKTNNYESTNH